MPTETSTALLAQAVRELLRVLARVITAHVVPHEESDRVEALRRRLELFLVRVLKGFPDPAVRAERLEDLAADVSTVAMSLDTGAGPAAIQLLAELTERIGLAIERMDTVSEAEEHTGEIALEVRIKHEVLLPDLQAEVPGEAAVEGGEGGLAAEVPSPEHLMVERLEAVRPAAAPALHEAELTEREPRYANAALLHDSTGEILDPSSPLLPGVIVRLRLDIGKLAAESQVRAAEAFPERNLPGDVNLDVMVSSSDFTIDTTRDKRRRFRGSQVAHGRLFLPGDGGPAIAPDGSRFLSFRLKAPNRAGTAYCRIGYYYRNILLQSQRLVAAVARGAGFRIETDFTLSADLTRLEVIPKRPRLSILTNSNGDGMHQFVLRSVTPGTADVKGRTFRINEDVVGDTVKRLRDVLTQRAPTTKSRTRSEIVEDLRQLSEPGWTLYTQLPAQHVDMFQPLYEQPDSFVIQVLRPSSSSFVLPWALVYEIPLLDPRHLEICPLVADWDGRSPLISGQPRQCPHGPHKQDVLCPFGFWGLRYPIEQLSTTDRPDLEIPFPASAELVMAETQVEVDPQALADHVEKLRNTLKRAFPKANLREAQDKGAVRMALGQDLPLVYFYCHGERKNLADPDTWLGVGKGEAITAKDFIGWVVAWLHGEKRRIWNEVRPLVFINACHSVAILPKTLLSYLDAFVGTAHAVGVIGTEVKINQELAADVGEKFFELLLCDRLSVESALRAIRLDYLSRGSLFGLVYTTYCWADLHIV